MMTFSCVRQWNLMLLRSIPAEAMSKPVLHPERGEMTFRELIETMAGHDLNHLAQLEAIAVQVPVSRKVPVSLRTGFTGCVRTRKGTLGATLRRSALECGANPRKRASQPDTGSRCLGYAQSLPRSMKVVL